MSSTLLLFISYIILCIITAFIIIRINVIHIFDSSDYIFVGFFSLFTIIVLPMLLLGICGKKLNNFIDKYTKKKP
jgi:hypothetical protein